MYVAVKGGEKAIDAAHALQESRRRGDTDLPELSVAQIEQQLNLAVDRVMTEGGIADRELAALALKQASGDNVEAIFLLRAYRTTLAKLAVSEPLDTTGMRLERRISAVYKDIPGGQLLGPTYDYTHRLLDFTLLANGEAPTLTTADSEQQPSPHVFSLLARQGLAKFEEDSGAQPDDITRTPPVYPCSRSSRLQQLMRGDEGYLLALAYSTQRGYGRNHPFAGEIRSGYIDVVVRDHGLEPGWHEARIEAMGAHAVAAKVLIIPEGPRLGIISDIDDTAMVTHVPRVLVAAWNQLVKYSSAREPVPGMAELYSRIQAAHPGTPMMYLSTGAWNVVPTLRSFFSRHGFPSGPALMTDWGTTNTGWFRSGIEHKRTELRRLMIDLPQITWILFGDDGQHDPHIYGEAARHHADRIAAVAIRRLTATQQVLAGGLTAHPMGIGPEARTLAEADVPVVVGTDGYELARLLPRELLEAAPRR